ncbi:MAG: 30S ribosomal protein S17 [Deltaproteobacteria bacterium]|nr:30S ribosomal protein S17 [Deltaproteobacteria bacterium]
MTDTVNRRTLIGTVISDKMEGTAVVAVERQFRHPKYNKQLRRTAKYKVHDVNNTAAAGDKVLIQECRPISKDKRWLLKDIIEKAV